MPAPRAFTGGRFVLDIEGSKVGVLKRFGGLAMEADIETEDLLPGVQKKHVSNVRWTPGTATVDLSMGKGMYEWIKKTFDEGSTTKNGTFTTADVNYKAESQVKFTNALLTEVTVPRLDGSSKDSGYIDVGFEPEAVQWVKSHGEDVRGKLGPKQKAWLSSNFRVEIGTLPCNRVATVDSFTWKCEIAHHPAGTLGASKHPHKVTVPNIRLGISHADREPWAEAARRWFIDGEHREANEMKGRIVFLAPNMRDELGEITLLNVGFKKFSDEDAEADSEKIRRFNVELYVEKMKFKLTEFDA